MLKVLLILPAMILALGSCEPTPKVAGVELRKLNFSAGGSSATMDLVVFDPRSSEVLVIDNGPRQEAPRYRNLQHALIANECIAGSNGGFFDGNFTPDGLMVSSGVHTGKLDAKSWMAGIFLVRNGKADLRSLKGFDDLAGVTQFLQTGPWLVKAGQPESGFLDDSTPRRRTFIGLGAGGRWVLGCCESATLHELARFLRDPQLVRIIDIETALNLDGGPSAAFCAKRGVLFRYVPEEWTVRNFIGIRVRK